MTNANIIPLTEKELETLANTEFFDIKQVVTKKIKQRFHLLKDILMLEAEGCKNSIPKEADLMTGRIFHGENYNGLPYFMLDFPRLFDKQQVFSFRCMCWWGKHFSFTLHLSGLSLEIYKESLANNIHLLKGHDFFYCVNTTPWNYTYEPNNYISLDSLINSNLNDLKQDILQRDFIKLSRKINIDQWDEILTIGPGTFRLCIELLKL